MHPGFNGSRSGRKTLTAGVYCFSSSAQLTGTLTLNAQGNANAVFIFKMGSTLTTASGSSVVLINGGSPCNVFWQVGSSATLGTTTSFAGNILALASITVTTGAQRDGSGLGANRRRDAGYQRGQRDDVRSPPTPIVTNYTVTVPFAQTVPHPCQPGFVLITGTMNVAITTTQSTDFNMQLQVTSAGRGEDADATGVLLPTGAPYYEYASDVAADATFPDGTPLSFEHPLTVTDYLARIGSTTDAFIMTTGVRRGLQQRHPDDADAADDRRQLPVIRGPDARRRTAGAPLFVPHHLTSSRHEGHGSGARRHGSRRVGIVRRSQLVVVDHGRPGGPGGAARGPAGAGDSAGRGGRTHAGDCPRGGGPPPTPYGRHRPPKV